MPRLLVIANLNKEGAERAASRVKADAASRGYEVDLFSFQGKPEGRPDAKGADAVVTIGGDGTVLFGARSVLPWAPPIFPVNLGRLGFIAELPPDSWASCFDSWRDGVLVPSERCMVRISLWRDGQESELFHVLNDGVVSGTGIAKIIQLEFAVDGQSFGFFQADGMIVATPTGSTAYSLAAGGPVLSPELKALVVNPICPFNLTNRPMVVGEDAVVDIRVARGQRSEIALTADGQEYVELREGDTVRFNRSPYVTRLVYSDGYAFHTVLRDKMNWAGGPRA